ncbi:hypothetical protein RZ760_005730 [Providencia rettgeri]|nr:hypothetical protein [Providencia rettgeri]
MVKSVNNFQANKIQSLQHTQKANNNSGITGDIKNASNSSQSYPAISQQNTNKVDSGIFKLKELKGIEKDVNSILKNMSNLLNNINNEHGILDKEINTNQFNQLSAKLNNLRVKTSNYQKRLDDVGYKNKSKKRETLEKLGQKLNSADYVKKNIEAKKDYKNSQAAKEAAKKADPNAPQYQKSFSVL